MAAPVPPAVPAAAMSGSFATASTVPPLPSQARTIGEVDRTAALSAGAPRFAPPKGFQPPATANAPTMTPAFAPPKVAASVLQAASAPPAATHARRGVAAEESAPARVPRSPALDLGRGGVAQGAGASAYPPSPSAAHPVAAAVVQAREAPAAVPVAHTSSFSVGPLTRPEPLSSSALIVQVRRDGSDGNVVRVDGQPVEIGRSRGAMLFPDDVFISPLHARMWVASGQLHIEDLGSRNGVYVRLSKAQPVYPGDRFLLGHHLLRLDNLPMTPAPAPDASGAHGFGTPLEPAWGRISMMAVGDIPTDIYDLRGSRVIFGREQGDIMFPSDPFLSRQHASLRMEVHESGMNVLLEDAGSANGTYLRARGYASLSAGEMFRVGDQLFRVKGGG